MSSRTWVTVVPVTAAFSAPASAAELMPSWRAWSWLTLTRNCRAGSIQSKLTCRVRGSAPSDLGELQRDAAHLVLVRARHPVLQRPADRRPELERRDAADDVGELLGQQLLELHLQPFARLDVLGDDHELGEERVGELDVERQDEADRAATDVGAVVVDVGVVLQQRLQALDVRLGRVDRRVLPQRHVHRQLGPVGRREELLRHEAQQEQRHHERRRA